MCLQYLPNFAADWCIFYRDNRKRRKGKKRQWELMRNRTQVECIISCEISESDVKVKCENNIASETGKLN
jgi:hypothetical protein